MFVDVLLIVSLYIYASVMLHYVISYAISLNSAKKQNCLRISIVLILKDIKLYSLYQNFLRTSMVLILKDTSNYKKTQWPHTIGYIKDITILESTKKVVTKLEPKRGAAELWSF